MNDTILIIGAGPSECAVDYPAIPPSWDTFGMNLAWRKYRERDFWPTYFGCFDYSVAGCQAAAYKDLLNDPACRIKHFYLVNGWGQDSSRLTILPQQDKRLPFSMDFASYGYGWCTGANCAQVAAIKGYKRIILVGIDGYKTEQVDGAVQDGKHLRIERPPRTNENYADPQYQQVGDVFNLPRGEVFHRPAWQKFAVFAEANGIKVINCSWGDVADCFPRSTLPEETAKAGNGGPLVTFIMALKSRSQRAIKSIDSVVTPENAKHIRFVVCEDKSGDMIQLHKLKHRDLVTVYRLNTAETWNRSKLLNYGIKRAATKYVAGWDADFVFTPGCIAKYLARLRTMDGDGQYLSVICTETADNVRHKGGKSFGYKKGQMWGHFLTHLRSHISTVNGYDEAFSYWGHEEVDLCNRLERQFGVSEVQLRERGLLLHISHDDNIRNKDKDCGNRNRELRERHDREGRNIVNEKGWGEPGSKFVSTQPERQAINMRPYAKKVFSQAGDDGIIKHIFDLIGTTNKRCVEFGERGIKGNTRLLREYLEWDATLFDAEPMTPDANREFVTAENIMRLLKKYKVPAEYDLLSIDIDGNDYWVWEAIDESKFKARVVIVEFNPNFPVGVSKTIAYNPAHEYDRTLYYGATLTALQRLGRRKGYTLVHVEAYLNLYFVADELLPALEDVESVFAYPLKVKHEADRWKNQTPTWWNKREHKPNPDLHNRPWVNIPETKAPTRPARWRPLRPVPKRERTALLIGNGPSTQELVDYGFKNIPDTVDTFGMGAVYRYCRRIKWWPTYYGWLDTKTVVSHEKALQRLVDSPAVPVRRFFFPYRLSESPRLTVTEHHSTGDGLFEMALWMGYTRLILIGIECQYVEVIPEAAVLADFDPDLDREFRERAGVPIPRNHLLIITKTPKKNPNYFFNGYQRKLDIYSKPNGKTSHAPKWRNLEQAYGNSGDLAVINCSPISTLNFERGNLKAELDNL